MKRQRILISALVLGLLVALLAGLGPVSSGAATAHRPTAGASGDDDTYSALVIGVHWEDIGTTVDAGAVNVLYSAAGGLSGVGDQFWYQDSSGIVDSCEDYDTFGTALAAGDFNGDGYTDLAVGIPGEEVSGESGAGAVHILYSSAGRLSAAGDEIWHQGRPGVEGGVEAGDSFGQALAAGDFDGDGYDDLAVGVPLEDKGDEENSGAVNVLYGSADGLSAAGNQIWDQDALPSDGTQPGDKFGWALAVGYFDDNDTRPTLVIRLRRSTWPPTTSRGMDSTRIGRTPARPWPRATSTGMDSAT